MSTIQQLLTEHLDIWAGADTGKKSSRGRSSNNAASVYGIKKLRELILELAVRGKLVPQDSNDEPASELLKRIQAEKNKLVVEKRIKKDKSLQPIEKEEYPYDLPKSWEWVYLPDVSNYRIGKTPSTKSNTYWTNSGSGFNWVSIADLNNNGHISKTNKQITNRAASEVFRTDPAPAGTILMSFKLTLGKVSILDMPAFHNEAIISIYPNQFIWKEFLFKILPARALAGDIKSAIKGNTLNSESIAALLVPLPPLTEQHRIVTKVDELMALCDQLEAQHNNAIEAHEKLISYLLNTLTQSQNAKEFSENWQRIAAHFDTLFTTEASIDTLKQILLQLAVMGKLVPQDPNDEPASELLKRIQAEKDKLIDERKIHKSKPLHSISENETPFELPQRWEWVRLFDIISEMDSGWSPACSENSSPSDMVWGVLKTTAVQVMQYLEHENKELPEKFVPRLKAEVKAGDILFTRAGPTNRVAISCFVQTTRPKLMISDKIIRFHPINTGIDGRFLTLCLNIGATSVYLENAKSGMAASQVNISQGKLRTAPIPLPPITEQHRIVAKIDKLIAICDQLKSRITEANQLKQKLADVMVKQAVVG